MAFCLPTISFVLAVERISRNQFSGPELLGERRVKSSFDPGLSDNFALRRYRKELEVLIGYVCFGPDEDEAALADISFFDE